MSQVSNSTWLMPYGENMKMKPLYVPAQITRVDATKQEVDLFVFVNEAVKSSKWRLLRSAMEEATPGYMEWANVRMQHDPARPIGVVRSCAWEEGGCKQTIYVQDADAWDKVSTGVLKGGSVGIKALTTRGYDVTKLEWFEVSLVDRPADPGARFLMARAEGAPDAEEENETEEETPAEGAARVSVADLLRGHFADAMGANEDHSNRMDGVYQGMDALHTALSRISREIADPKDRKGAVKTAMTEAHTHMAGIMGGAARAEGDDAVEQTMLARVEAQAAEIATLRTQMDGLQNGDEIRRLQSQVATLRGEPVRYQPIKFPSAARGTPRAGITLDGQPAQGGEEKGKVVARMQEIQKQASDPEFRGDRVALATEFGTLKLKLGRLVSE